MLVNLNAVLDYAEKNNCGISAFNTPTLENMQAVIAVAEKMNVPVIMMHAECHESDAPLAVIGPVMKLMAEKAKVPVCIHLDHCEHMDYLKEALAIGFTSVMLDASSKSYDENVALTREAVKLAKAVGASVEAEIGVLGGREAGDARPMTKEEMYTDPALAKRFVDDTKIDALACSFGTAHGIYKVKPELDFDRIVKIKSLVNVPIVMHGGSGLSDDDYRKAIKCGVRKINCYSYIAKRGVMEAKKITQTDVTFYHEVASAVIKGMEEDIEKVMEVVYEK